MTTNVSGRTRPLQRFASHLGDLWPQVAPLCIDLGDDDRIALSVSTHRSAHGADPRLRLLAGDLDALLAGWEHFGSDERALLRGAISYLEHEGSVADNDLGLGPRHADTDGPTPADGVVGAAVRTLLRG